MRRIGGFDDETVERAWREAWDAEHPDEAAAPPRQPLPVRILARLLLAGLAAAALLAAGVAARVGWWLLTLGFHLPDVLRL